MSDKKRIEALKNFLARDPNDSFSRYALALEVASDGHFEESIIELQELVSRDPNYIAGFHQLGKMLTKMNRTQEAKNIYRLGIDLATKQNNLLEKNELIEELEEIEDEW